MHWRPDRICKVMSMFKVRDRPCPTTVTGIDNLRPKGSYILIHPRILFFQIVRYPRNGIAGTKRTRMIEDCCLILEVIRYQCLAAYLQDGMVLRQTRNQRKARRKEADVCYFVVTIASSSDIDCPATTLDLHGLHQK